MKKLNIMVVGAGGNNSWFLRIIHELQRKNQIPETVEFTVFDADTVEKKNLLYQDFELKDVMDNKAAVLATRYAMKAQTRYVKDQKDFEPYDVVVCGVDNKEFRELLYRYMDVHPEKYWIDLRAEGRTIAVLAKHKTVSLETLLGTLPEKSVGSTSCQLSYELENNIIQLGNRIAANIGAQYLLNYLRGEENPPSFVHMF